MLVIWFGLTMISLMLVDYWFCTDWAERGYGREELFVNIIAGIGLAFFWLAVCFPK